MQSKVDLLPTIRWAGYKFRFQPIVFSEDDMESESILLPLAMFEDFLKEAKLVSPPMILEEIQSGEYKSKLEDSKAVKLCVWLQRNSLFSLLQSTDI